MPVDVPAEVPAPRIAPSAPIELSSLLCTCASVARKPLKVDIPPALVDRANRFWGDGHGALGELVVLAHATGTLGDMAIEPFLDAVREPVPFDAPLPLESETDEERAVINARLERLASDRRLRARYAAVLADLWSAFEPVWDATGRELTAAAAASWAARLEGGASPLELLQERHIARRHEEFAVMVRDAERDGILWLAPTAAGYGHILALPGLLSVAAEAVAHDLAVVRRQAAAEITDRLRALADTTRLTILGQLARDPAGVTELARALHIAQPTASVHLRQLREAGLVSARRDGNRTIYSIRPAAVDDLLADVGRRLARALRAEAPHVSAPAE